jgi:predicted Zn-dependent protease
VLENFRREKMITRDEANELCQKILKISPSEETEVFISDTNRSLTRFANNIIHQNVTESSISASIILHTGKKVVRVSTNRFDEESLRRVLREGMEIAHMQKEIPDLPPLAEPQIYQEVFRFDEETAKITPQERARVVKKAVKIASKRELNAAGVMEAVVYAYALANSKGLSCYHRETQSIFSITCMSDSSSGWAQCWTNRFSEIEPEMVASIASKKAIDSKNPQEIKSGKYTAILEPAAVSDILLFLLMGFNGLSVYEKRSYFTDKMGQKLFGDNITIEDNVYHPLQLGEPFDGEGLMRKRIVLIDRGVAKNLVYDRLTAKRMGVEPTGHGFLLPNATGAYPLNLVFYGQSKPLEKMILETERGILITHLWYIRYLDPVKLTITGMTRDGTFLIENGRIKCGIKNMRFNISISEMLNNIEDMGIETRGSGIEAVPMVVPPLRVKDFEFSEPTLY